VIQSPTSLARLTNSHRLTHEAIFIFVDSDFSSVHVFLLDALHVWQSPLFNDEAVVVLKLQTQSADCLLHHLIKHERFSISAADASLHTSSLLN